MDELFCHYTFFFRFHTTKILATLTHIALRDHTDAIYRLSI